jgi:hypothetical protein
VIPAAAEISAEEFYKSTNSNKYLIVSFASGNKNDLVKVVFIVL